MVRAQVAGKGGRLEGEVAIVTGSTSGLGAEVARLFGEEGASVVVTGRSAERGEAVARQIAESGGEGTFFPADLGEERACAELVRHARERYGSLTVLVNNAVGAAGPRRDGPAADVSPETWEHVLRIDVVAVGWLLRHAIPAMIDAGHGSIVNVSSRTAEHATPRVAVYTAAKGALNALTRSVSTDYARQGIRCNTVQPGYILHERRDANNTPERTRQIEEMHLTRVPTARDVAHAALFLASRDAEVITGVTLQVDGGSSFARARAFG